MRPSVTIISFLAGALAISLLTGSPDLARLLACLLAFLILAKVIAAIFRPSPAPGVQDEKANRTTGPN